MRLVPGTTRSRYFTSRTLVTKGFLEAETTGLLRHRKIDGSWKRGLNEIYGQMSKNRPSTCISENVDSPYNGVTITKVMRFFLLLRWDGNVVVTTKPTGVSREHVSEATTYRASIWDYDLSERVVVRVDLGKAQVGPAPSSLSDVVGKPFVLSRQKHLPSSPSPGPMLRSSRFSDTEEYEDPPFFRVRTGVPGVLVHGSQQTPK